MAGNFECIQCGKCCLGIGSIVKMDKQLSKYGFVVKNDVVREMRQCLVTPEYRDIFDNDHSVQKKYPSACYFVRRLENGKYVCTIHPYRLHICSTYHCCSARILKNGVEVGKIKGKASLESKDEALIALWNDKIISQSEIPAEDVISKYLNDAGYEAIFYSGE